MYLCKCFANYKSCYKCQDCFGYSEYFMYILLFFEHNVLKAIDRLTQVPGVYA